MLQVRTLQEQWGFRASPEDHLPTPTRVSIWKFHTVQQLYLGGDPLPIEDFPSSLYWVCLGTHPPCPGWGNAPTAVIGDEYTFKKVIQMTIHCSIMTYWVQI